jgi:hypothetical protein
MPDHIRDNEISNKALAYAIKAIDGLPEQSQERDLQQRIKFILDVNVPDARERGALLDNVDRHLNGRGASLSKEIKELIENSHHPVVMSMFLFQAI